MSSTYDTIAVVDYGESSPSQTGHLIASRIRRSHVYSEIVPAERLLEYVKDRRVKGIVLPGGPASVYEADAPLPEFEYGLPVLGVCYGLQLIAYKKRGLVKPAPKREFGRTKIRIPHHGALLEGLEPEENVWMSHGDFVEELPEKFTVYAESDNCPVAAFGNEEEQLYGVQFHPEQRFTTKGQRVLENFAIKIAGCNPTWSMKNYVEEAIDKIRRQVGGDNAIVAFSGGVDSSVVTALGSLALGNRLTAVLVDHGGMRYGEIDQIREAFERHYNLDLRVIDASERYLKRLKGVADPERKRKIIGGTFAHIFLEEARKIGANWLFQGTIYPDIIETRGRIKSHHNLHPLILRYFSRRRGLVEPLIELYKDDVREVGKQMGLPEEIIWRQPFPGPGLFIRVEGQVTRERLRIVGEADKIVREEMDRLPLEDRPWQYFAYLTKSKATGVTGDKRAFGNVLAIRAVDSDDAMSADFSRLDWGILEKISSRITNEIPEVRRVVLDITSKPPATIEFQ